MIYTMFQKARMAITLKQDYRQQPSYPNATLIGLLPFHLERSKAVLKKVHPGKKEAWLEIRVLTSFGLSSFLEPNDWNQ